MSFTVLNLENVKKKNQDQTVNLVVHTLEQDKQVLIFNNSKSRSEATADRVAKVLDSGRDKLKLKELSEKVLKSLANPTKQCRRLAQVIEKGVAFHHSGLVAKQRSLIEQGFKEGLIKVISSTPTLAAGLNLPAYKVIINDYKRYSSRGFNDIPILEFHQMAGRAGRPGREDIGKAVVVVKSEQEAEYVVPKFIYGEAEEIISKLAVEPTLKMYLLSLISMDLINSKTEIKEFFKNTLYAHQYKDLDSLNHNLFRILDILKDYDFLSQEDDYYISTPIGKKISELYLNPDTANYFLEHIEKFIQRFSSNNVSREDVYSLIYFIADTPEMKPLFSLSKLEYENYMKRAEEIGDHLIVEFNPFEADYENFLKTLKASNLFQDWIHEAPEDFINEKYRVTPGELHYKLDVMDWLLYCMEEIALMKKSFFLRNFINKLRIRFKAGIREELIPLISLKGVGRVRARNLYKAGFKKIFDLKRADFASLSRVVGDSLTIKIKEQISDSIIDETLDVKPKEIQVREVSDEEIDVILDSINQFEKEKEEKSKGLLDYF